MIWILKLRKMRSIFPRKIFLFKSHFSKSFCSFSSEYAVRKNYKDKEKRPHTPVMVKEIIEHLNLKEGDTFLDMTFGAGKHSEALLESIPNIQVFALDRDPKALEFGIELEKKYPGQVKSLEGKFSDLPHLLNNYNVKPDSLDGILFDLGCSSMQLDNAERGFSVIQDGPLDMRMDGGKSKDITAADVVAYAQENDLYKIFKIYGGEKKALKVARAIVQARGVFKSLKTTQELSELIKTVCQNEKRTDKLGRKVSVATKIFQALRIFVNNEINELNYGIMLAHKYLKPGGRAAVLTFHSGEDIIVKRQFNNLLVDNSSKAIPLIYVNSLKSYSSSEMKDFLPKNWIVVNKKVIVPTKEEVDLNPRSRSAKLRVAIKNAPGNQHLLSQTFSN